VLQPMAAATVGIAAEGRTALPVPAGTLEAEVIARNDGSNNARFLLEASRVNEVKKQRREGRANRRALFHFLREPG
jgi:hypothetical protein